MQSRYKNIKPDLITKTAFQRDDELSDTLFYQSDRMVSHIDEQAQTVLSDLHGMLIEPGMSVLDLMSSWQTHIPKTLDLNELKGIGLNRNELSANPGLTDYRVHDLNNDPTIPFPDKSFDVVICSLSIEYLVKPVEIFREVARILKPKGKFIVTFSNRWFPTKAIRLWKELHEFERVGLVTEYFLESGKFNSLNTFSHRGYPRPWEDKYFSESRYSDPIFGVTGKLAD